MTHEVRTFCRLCEVMCGLTATVDEGRLIKVRGDKGHPVSKGFACNKGLLAVDVHHDPDRLDHPQRRTAHGWETIGMTQAVAEVAARLQAVIDEHGPGAVALYIGNPAAFNYTAGSAGALFLLTLGSDRLFSAGTQDCSNKFTAADVLYGSPGIHPIPDLARTDHLLLIGTNPRISKSSFLSVPDPVAAIRSVRERGGSVTFVNPLRIEPDIGPTLQIRPDTDVFLLAAILCELERTVGFDLGTMTDHVDNLEGLRTFVRQYPPERVADVVGLSSDEIIDAARSFAAAPTASVHTSTGLNMGRNGLVAYYLVQMLSMVTGNFDRPGGNYAAARGLAPNPSTSPPDQVVTDKTPVGDVRRSNSLLPAGLIADWIRSDEQPIKALINIAGNPALSVGDSAAMREAMEDLDLMVSIDFYRNATGELADYVFPATDWFERDDLNYFVQGVQVDPHVQWTDAVVEPRGERTPEWKIFTMLLEAMGQPVSFPLDRDALATMADPGLAEVGLSIAELAARERPVAVLANDTIGSFVASTLATANGRIDAAPSVIAAGFDRVAATFDDLNAETDEQLKLISKRIRTGLNSAFQNVEKLKSRGAATNPAWMNPADADRLGLTEGGRCILRTGTGTIEADVAFDENLRVGTVAMTHGFGNDRTPAMTTAHAHPGVNVNELMPAGLAGIDPISGMAHLTGVPVDVTPAQPSGGNRDGE